ncbi:baculoviral IAP repeat-containing protein 2-like [Gigantopelta aegis]|uniref:baculoviral IAP repeat-containing protein 2-like n=1 Tax=Gigantopelta aegis TaxID=1735272 RepID=UPI001B88DF3B|nr:baculoviral IAP repeat-containing protein 2-like [Gigantopelta aegis]XP_041363983.1 baculoviral IAP repeat-containing protein 2-like [Gigantopelta aegis]XP_041363992.1 baculoviral IAP repeat-containing protein 2-like [Gigantopelta aegis]
MDSDVEVDGGVCLTERSNQIGTCRHKPKWPQYKDYVSRMDSFVDWPRKYVTQTPHSLASSGLFYIGSADRVTCFDCGITIRNWEPEQDPYVEHLRLSPDCRYVSSLSRNDPSNSAQVTSSSSSTTTSSSNNESSDPSHGTTQPTGASCTTVFDPNNKTVQTVIEMGFSEEHVKTVIIANNKDSVLGIVEAIMLLNTKQKDNIFNAEKTDLQKNDESKVSGQTFYDVQHSDRIFGPDSEISEDTDVESSTGGSVVVKTKEENSRLKLQRMCRRCRREEAVMLCLPCGHIPSCLACIEKTNTCFVCDAKIEGTVRTYLS